MADIVIDGQVRVYFVSAIANQNAPTTSELNAGVALQDVMTPDGLQNFQPTTATVDNSALSSTFTTSTIGRDSFGDSRLQFKRQSGTDTVWNTLTRGTAGFIVIRRNVAAGTAWSSTQAVEVYPMICGQTIYVDPAPNEVSKWQLQTPITASPSIRAAVA